MSGFNKFINEIQEVASRDDAVTVDKILDWASADAGPICCDDEYRRLEKVMRAATYLLEALEDLVKINERHNASIESVIGKPAGWNDEYLNQARTAIARARGEA